MKKRELERDAQAHIPYSRQREAYSVALRNTSDDACVSVCAQSLPRSSLIFSETLQVITTC
jgi:hypothetical protein